MMEGGEGPSAPMEGAVVSAGSGSDGLGAAESAGIIVSSGGASLEGAPSLVDEDAALPPAIPAGDEQNGAEDVQQPQQQPAPPSPVRRVDFGLLAGRSDVPTPNQIFDLSQILKLKTKAGVMSNTVAFLRPLNLQHHRLPPPHFIAWDDFSWRDVINALYIWNLIYSLDQRKNELKKSTLLRTNNAPRYRRFQRKIDELHNNRPAAAADNEDNSSSDAAPPRRSVRRAESQQQQQIDVLVEREQQRTSDPTVQQRARQQARANNSGQRQRTRVSVASMVPVPAAVPIEIVGVGSGEADRAGVVQERQDGRQSWRKRKQGENCTTAGGMNDAAAHGMMHTFHRTAAIAVETLHYPNLGRNQPRHDVMAVSLNDFADYNPNGGRSFSAGKRALKPTITLTAESRPSAIHLLKQLAKGLEGMKDADVGDDGLYDLPEMSLRCNFKDATTSGTPLFETVQHRHDSYKRQKLSRPSRHHNSMAQIQQALPASIAAGADMSPGIRDRPPSDASNE